MAGGADRCFDESFLEVPPEVLSTSMKTHQKCFSLKEGEMLANRFIVVANLEAADSGKAIVAGNERVIAARLADAKFFFDHDRKIMLEERVPELREIVFHEKLGTQYERVQRVRVLAREIAKLVHADPDLAERAAILAKADLVTDIVGEFPELQGVMGRYYALDQEEAPEVADAIALTTSRSGLRMRCRASRWLLPWRSPTSSTCWSASGRSTRSRPARKTLTRFAAPPSASSASCWRTILRLPLNATLLAAGDSACTVEEHPGQPAPPKSTDLLAFFADR